MLSHYFAIALRSLNGNRVYSLINVFGLTLGLGCALVIYLFVADELSYDRYHDNANRIYRVILRGRLQGKTINGAVSPAPMAQAIVDEIPDVETAARLWRRDEVLVGTGDRKFIERVYYADGVYFKIFTHPLIEGDPRTALVEPNSIVLTQTGAKKYFGTRSALGEALKLNDDDYVVTGIAEDIPHNSHVHFDYLASLVTREDSRNQMWVSNNYFTYLLLAEDASVPAIVAKINSMVRKYAGPQTKAILNTTFEEFERSGGRYEFELQALSDVHLRSNFDIELETNGDIDYVYTFSFVAILVLLVACGNYTNLTTARATKRGTEIGMRKTLGANRQQLVRQLLGESILLTAASCILAIGLTSAALPAISAQLQKPLSLSTIAPIEILAAFVLVLLVGLVAGAYPALLLSRFRPQEVLTGSKGLAGSRGLLRSVLVVFQFVVSVVLVVGTLVVHGQIRYVQAKHLGFDQEHVLVVKRAWPIRKKMDAFRQELLRDAGIVAVAGCDNVPGEWFNNSAFLPEGSTGDQSYLLWRLTADENFIGTMGMTVSEGRDFSRDFASDSSAVLLNQTAAQLMGWADDPIGKRILQPGFESDESITHSVIGVVDDFHFESLREEIRPLIIQNTRHKETNGVQSVVIRIRTDDVAGTLQKIEESWKTMAPGHPLMCTFLRDDLDALYRADQKTVEIATGFSLLAILIGCLGLFGLTSFMAEQRTKEIGVRKVLGASGAMIVQMLSTDIVRPVIIGNLIAWPIAYTLLDSWLQAFAYRAELGIGHFLLGGGLALAVALVTVGYQTAKAAGADPVDALRYE